MMDFKGQHRHSVGAQCKMDKGGKRKLRAKLLARLINGKIKLSVDYSVAEIMKDLELELRITSSYMQSWRAKEYVRLLIMGKLVDQYKMVLWISAALVRANVDSRAFVELDGCRFRWMFITCRASLNGFVL